MWRDLRGATELPFSLNPESGILVSANNRPAEGGLRVGYFFSPDDRVDRMTELLGGGGIGLDAVKALQRDVFMPSSVALRDALAAALDARRPAPATTPEERRALALMRDWDGHYRRDSRGAVAFEAFRDAFTRTFYAGALGEEDLGRVRQRRRDQDPDDRRHQGRRRGRPRARARGRGRGRRRRGRGLSELGGDAPARPRPSALLPAADRRPLPLRRPARRRQHRHADEDRARHHGRAAHTRATAPTRATSPTCRTSTATTSSCSAARTAASTAAPSSTRPSCGWPAPMSRCRSASRPCANASPTTSRSGASVSTYRHARTRSIAVRFGFPACPRPPTSSCPDLFRASTSCGIAVWAGSGRVGGGTWLPGTSPMGWTPPPDGIAMCQGCVPTT